MLRIVLVLALVTVVAAEDDGPLVQTVYGIVRGTRNVEGRYSSFTGIRYAQGPTGRNRFRSASPPASWQGIFEANRNDIACVQANNGILIGTEDCLTVNIYRPDSASPENPVAVMVYFYGGGFASGSVQTNTEEFLIKHNVIVVLVNSRVNAPGYLCLRHELIPGNAGFKDQVAALRWVQQNIVAFGGDPHNITIMGQSAGAASVDLLTLSPMTNGLFNRAIAISGSARTYWAVNSDPIKYATTMAQKYLGYDGNNIEDLVELYLNIDNESLVRATMQYYIELQHNSLPVAACVENVQNGVEAFLTEWPADILESGRYTSVPCIYIANNKEYINMLMSAEVDNVEALIQTLEIHLPLDLDFHSYQQRTEIANRVRKFYFNNETSILKNYVDYKSDSMFYYPIIRAVKERQSKSTSPIYFLEFTYESDQHFPRFPETKGITGSAHSDDLLYLIWPMRTDQPITIEDQLTVDRYTTLLTNFAKYGDPTPGKEPVAWPPVNEDQFNYLQLGTQLTVLHSPNAAAVALWDEIYAATSSASLLSSIFASLFWMILIIFNI